jgi:hypothetical protein
MKITLSSRRKTLRTLAAAVKPRVDLSMFLLVFALVSGPLMALPAVVGQPQALRVLSGTLTPKFHDAPREGADQVPRLDGITVKSGILAFSTLEAYEKNYPVILNMSSAQADSWEHGMGFVSQRNIFNQIVKAEYAYLVTPYEGLSNAQLKRMAAPKGHSAIYNKYLRLGVIKMERDVQGEESYTSALPIRGYLPIVDERGFFIVGNTIYQIKDEFIKEMASTEISKLRVLDKASANNPVSDIKVQTVAANSVASKSAAAASSCSYPRSSGWITSGSRRGMTTVNLSKTYWNPYPYSKVTVSYDVNVKSQKKNVWGNWVYPSCPNECWISFNWTSVFDYMSKATLGYAGSTISPRSYSYPHPNCINDFNISLNPISGTSAPYPSSFTFTAPAGLAFLDVSMKNALWHASVPGGSSGITCDVSCP